MEENRKPRRVVRARKTAALGSVAAIALGIGAPAHAVMPDGEPAATETLLLNAQAEGEGEGEAAAGGEGEGEGEGAGQNLPDEVAFLRDLGFMTGHMRAGLALYEDGDIEAAKTHMGHPIEEKYDAVAAPLEAQGFGDLRDDILAVAAAVEAGEDYSQVKSLFDTVIARVEDVRGQAAGGVRAQMLALAALARIAGEEYEIAITDGEVTNIHEYQDSWGFLRTIENEARQFAESDDPAVAEAGQRFLEQVALTNEAFGDLQGRDIPNPDSSLIFGPASRMEVAALGVGA